MGNSPLRRWQQSKLYPGFRKTALVYRLLLRLKATFGLCRVQVGHALSWGLKEFLADVCPNASAVVVLLGVDGPAQKVILQIWDKKQVIGYLKYAEKPAARTRVAHEYEILRNIPQGIGPTVMKYGKLGDGDGLLISQALGQMIPARLPPPPSVPHFVTNLISSSAVELSKHPWVQKSLERYGQAIEPWLDILDSRKWPVAYQHGDLAPWNLLQASNRLTGIDWEYGTVHGFPYMDLAQYYVQVGALIYRWSPRIAHEHTIKYLCGCFQFLSRHEAHAVVCLATYIAYCEAHSDGHSPTSYLQCWRRSLWEHQKSVD